MKRADIENLAIIKLEEYSPFAPNDDANSGPLLNNFGDVLKEVKPIYEYVSASITEAGNEILRVAPLNKLIPEEYTDRVMPDRDRPTTGTIELPDDYLRLHTLQMCSWKRPVHEVVQPEDPNFHDQDYEATAGNFWKPVVTQEDMNLHYYSVRNACCHRIEKMLYVPRYEYTPNFTDAVGELIALNCARKVYEVFGNVEQMKMMDAEITIKLENLKK